MSYHLYCDGGVIKKNPSPIGGTYCWVLVKRKDGIKNPDFDHEEDKKVCEGSGIVFPCRSHPLVTNNVTEMVAMDSAIRGYLKHRAKKMKHEGEEISEPTLYSDSQMAIERFFGGWSWNCGVPNYLVNRYQQTMKSMSESGIENGLRTILLAGHPTRKDLEQNFKVKKTGGVYIVSKWNVYCDKVCGNISAKHQQEHNLF